MPFLRALNYGYANRNQTIHLLKGSAEVKQVSNYYPKKALSILKVVHSTLGFPGGSVVKNLPSNTEDVS